MLTFASSNARDLKGSVLEAFYHCSAMTMELLQMSTMLSFSNICVEGGEAWQLWPHSSSKFETPFASLANVVNTLLGIPTT